MRLETSTYLLFRAPGDDACLDGAAFDAQQSLEFLILHILSEKGIEAPKTHDIEQLYTLLKTTGFTFSMESDLLGFAAEVTRWEIESREKTGCLCTISLVKFCHEIINSMRREFIESLENADQSAEGAKISSLLKGAEG